MDATGFLTFAKNVFFPDNDVTRACHLPQKIPCFLSDPMMPSLTL